MKTYTFYLHDGPEGIPAFEIEMLEDRQAAMDFAHNLLAERSRYDRVIVTEEAVEIARFDRSAPRPAENEGRSAAQS